MLHTTGLAPSKRAFRAPTGSIRMKPHKTLAPPCATSPGSATRTKNGDISRWLLHACAPLLLMLSACGASGGDAAPTLSLEAISTSAYQTFSAEMATKLALTPPSNTPAPSPFPTLPLPSPFATFAFASSTPLTGGGSDCDNLAYVADVTIPDKTRLDPGQKFVKTWLVQNTGTCTWTTSYKLSHVDGQQMSGSAVYVPLPVPPAQQVQMSVDLKAPTSPGDYYGRWQVQNEQKRAFGSFLTVVIKVVPLAP